MFDATTLTDAETETVATPTLTAEKKRELDKLLRQHEASLRRLAMRLVTNEADADDILQDAMLRAYKAYPNFRGDSQFFTWMYTIVRNVACNYLTRRTRNARVMSSLNDLSDSADDQGEGGGAAEWFENLYAHNEDPCALLETQQAHDKIIEALGRLETDMPEIFIALNDVVLKNRSYEEVAQEAGLPVGNIRSRVFRGRQYLAKVLREMEGEEDYSALIKPRLML
jgi:RNA polymerase sigma-70 factor, ECF subfamily